MAIGGNIVGIFQTKIGTKNAIGETITTWHEFKKHKGFLDYQTGDSRHNNYNAKLQESTHIFISDYFDVSKLKPNNCRFVYKGEIYEVLLIDDPMNLHQHLEIYLKFVG